MMDDQPKKQERLRTRWTSSQDKIFADLVVEQIVQGNRSNNVFDQKAWKHIRDQFNAQTGLNFNKKQLRKHLEVLRTRYHNLKSAFEQNGFNLEQSNHMAMAIPDYEIWGDLIEEPPKRETLKIKDCPIYDQLCVIFTETERDGKYAQSSHYEGLENNAIGVDSPSARLRLKPANPHIGEGTPGSTLLLQNNGSSPSAGVVKKENKKRKNRSSETPYPPHHLNVSDQEKLIEAMVEAMSDMVSASKMRTVGTTQLDDRFSISNCIKALDEIQGIDESLYFAALDLFDNPSYRETFLSLQSEIQFGWLHEKCRNMSSSSVV